MYNLPLLISLLCYHLGMISLMHHLQAATTEERKVFTYCQPTSLKLPPRVVIILLLKFTSVFIANNMHIHHLL